MNHRLLYLLFIISCRSPHENLRLVIPSIVVESIDTSLHFINGYLYRGNQLYAGEIIERDEKGSTIRRTSYLSGREEGWMYSYFREGNLSEKRFYHKGEKDSVHVGWWPNGNHRFEYHFVSGLYHGDYKEWYANGERYKHIHYTGGKEDWAKGWRENGKVYMNFIVKNGRRYGLENTNLCYTVRNEQGEYVNSIKP